MKKLNKLILGTGLTLATLTPGLLKAQEISAETRELAKNITTKYCDCTMTTKITRNKTEPIILIQPLKKEECDDLMTRGFAEQKTTEELQKANQELEKKGSTTLTFTDNGSLGPISGNVVFKQCESTPTL